MYEQVRARRTILLKTQGFEDLGHLLVHSNWTIESTLFNSDSGISILRFQPPTGPSEFCDR